MKTLIALILYWLQFKPNISTGIDEDTILMGYGTLYSYGFKYGLPSKIINKHFKTSSWNEYNTRKFKQAFDTHLKIDA